MLRTKFHLGRPASAARLRQRAFTLVEVMIGASLSTLVLAGTLSAFLMLGRTGANLANYSVAETQIRRGLEEFSQDVRMASDLAWTSASSFTLTVPTNYAAHGNLVTYAYDSATQNFYRRPGDGVTTPLPALAVLIPDVSSFSYTRYNRLDAAATSNADTNRLLITLNVQKTGRTLVAANTTLVSSSYTLRNKPAN
jgi:type II secretory pathway pseudopilin PulG